jgi:hypothetical protein
VDCFPSSWVVVLGNDKLTVLIILSVLVCASAIYDESYSGLQFNDCSPISKASLEQEKIQTSEISTLDFPSPYDAFSPIGNYSINEAYQVQAIGEIAYYGLGMHLAIYNISIVTNPTLISTLWVGGIVEDIYVNADTAYVAAGEGGISIIDVGNLEHPTILGHYLPDSPAMAVHGYNDTLFSVSRDEGLEVVDVSNMSEPILLSSWRPGGEFHNIDVKDNIAVIACGDYGAYFINVSDLHSISGWGLYDPPPGHVLDVLFGNGYVFAHMSQQGVIVIDVSGSSPTYVTRRDYDGMADFDIKEGIVYAPDFSNGLTIVNITNPVSPTLIKAYTQYDYISGMSVVGNFSFNANSQFGIQVMNVTDLQNIEVISTTTMQAQPRGFEVVGNYCYLADTKLGLTILDISNPLYPTVASVCRTSSTGHNISFDVTISEDIAYVANDNGLCTVNVSDPYNPVFLDYMGHIGSGQYRGIGVSGNYCYMGGNWEFTAYNVTDPTNITVAGTYPGISGTITGLYIDGSIAYVSETDISFWALNVTDPSSITSIWSLDLIDYGEDIYSKDDLVFCMGSDSSGDWVLYVRNVSEASNPTPVFTRDLGSFTTLGLYRTMSLYQDIFFMSGHEDIIVLNITDTSQVAQLAKEFDNTRGFVFQDEFVYLSNYGGWWILQHDLDFDGLFSYDEIQLGIDPWDPDNDHDDMPAGWEVDYGLDPTKYDADDDLDMDTLTNIEEYLEGTYPNNPDCDLDTLLDGIEVHTYGSNPWSNDSDSDTMLDPYEAAFGLNLTLDDALEDLDGDTLSNIYEMNLGTFPNTTDSDQDVMPDNWEVYYRLNPLIDDADEDLDLDGVTNLQEFYAGTNPNDHGLRWGVQVNHTIICDLATETNILSNHNVDEKVIIGIEDTPEAPVDLYYIPAADYLGVWARNMTPFSLSGFFTFDSILLAPAYPAIMKGNWTLLNEVVDLLDASNPDVSYEINETETTWGFRYTMATGEFSLTSSGEWFKSDGTLKQVSMQMLFANEDYIRVDLTRGFFDSPETRNFTLIIAIGAGGAAVIVLGLVVYLKKKGH